MSPVVTSQLLETSADELILYTIDEVAAMLKVDPSTVSRMISRGELTAVKFSGRTVRVKRSDLVEFIEQSRSC
jgi:excisionase family DNA binding protein